ncbi:MAG: hypothetical protein KDI30_12565 [Pseudomonadales bacterium]|nr:hypothetical protein [Pseudomonadales bacterium]
MLRSFVFIVFMAGCVSVNASESVENNKKIQYFSDAGFGVDEAQGAFSLENTDIAAGTCLWDVILFDQTFAETLKTAYEKDQILKKIVFSVDEETGDCYLKQLE